MDKSKWKLGAFLVALTVLFSVTAVAVGSAEAARGGGGGGGKGGKPTPTPPPSTATVTLISQNPVPVGTAPTFRVSGYAPGAFVYLTMSGFIRSDSGYADSTGSMTYTFYQAMYNTGTYTFSTVGLNGSNPASVTFNVQ
jgi:hypothetical protein